MVFKGREDMDDVRKIKCLRVCCVDINSVQMDYTYTPVYVKQELWEEWKKDLKSFGDIYKIFKAE